MEFGEHIFLISSQKGPGDLLSSDWVSTFHSFLELLLSRLSGEEVHINKIDIDELDIKKIYSPSTILIPVVSQELLNSPVFKSEIKLFYEKAINKSVNNISWESRIFKVVRQPQKGHFLLDYLNSSISYDFFHFDAENDELIEYNDFTGPDSEQTFWLRLYDLAYDIFKVMEVIRSAESEIENISKDLNKITVFLAEVGSDLIPERNAVKRELMRSGYKVLPENSMPEDLESIRKLVRSDLAKSNMTVHLVGSDYGLIQGTNISIVDLQNKMAAEHFNELEAMDAAHAINFGRVIWISQELSNVSVKQRLLIENLKKDSVSMSKAELLETTIEKLKNFILNKIQESGVRSGIFQSASGADRRKIVYLIHNKSEARKCRKIESFLLDCGYEVITPDFKGNPTEVRMKHNENLRKCDASLIYYGHENEDWIRSKQKDIMKSQGIGRDKPIEPQAILIENESQLIESLEFDEKALILMSDKKFSPQVISPFIEQLENK